VGDSARIPLLRPEPPGLGDVAPYYALAEAAGVYANGGPCHGLLADRLAEYLGGDVSCVPLASGTAALMVGLRATLPPPGPGARAVALPSYTFTAGACAVAWAGYEPLFVDVLPDSWQMCPDALEDAIVRSASPVAGVLGSATFGVAPPVDVRAAWRDVSDRAGVPLVLDSAAGFGSRDDEGRLLGGCGDTEVFSFHATKPFAIGEGGLLATPDPEVAARAGRLANFGLELPGRTSVEVGLNAKLSELACATGLAMLDRFDDVLARRRHSAERLREAIADAPVALQGGAERSSAQLMPIRTQTPLSRRAVVEAARRSGVEVRTYHDPPLHRHPAFAACARGDLDETERLCERSLSLPMANDLTDDETAAIAGCVEALC
jgi:dTDP-4-amino-4,6-dideoxygalactose transaminase